MNYQNNLYNKGCCKSLSATKNCGFRDPIAFLPNEDHPGISLLTGTELPGIGLSGIISHGLFALEADHPYVCGLRGFPRCLMPN